MFKSKWYFAVLGLVAFVLIIAFSEAQAQAAAAAPSLRLPTALEWAWMAFVVGGANFHWLSKYMHDPASNGFMRYWFGGSSGDKSDSMVTAATLVVCILTGLATGFAGDGSPYHVLITGFLGGYSLDSFFNRGDSPPQPPPAA